MNNVHKEAVVETLKPIIYSQLMGNGTKIQRLKETHCGEFKIAFYNLFHF